MPSINLTDQLSLDVNVQAAATSALLKYFQQLRSLRLDSIDLSKLGGLTLDNPAIQSLSSGLSFDDPIGIGSNGTELTIAAGVHGSVRIVADATELPGSEDDPESAKDACYMCVAMEATASADLEATSGVLQFGATPSTTVGLMSGSRFAAKSSVTLLQAIQQTIGSFALPATCDDLAGMAAGQIAQVTVNGTLTVSGTANLLAITNPLAAATLPAPLPGVSVSAGGSVTIGATCSIATDYDVVARKLDSGAVRIGWHRKIGRDVSIQVTASEGIAAEIGSTDVFPQLIAAISGNPAADLAALKTAGMAEAQMGAIDGAVKAAVNRKLQIAVEAQLTGISEDSVLFLYDVVPTALDNKSRAAVERGLRGDLTDLHAGGLSGVSCVRSVWETVRTGQVELDVNLLGVLNYRSAASLSLEGKVLYEPASGALVISDAATADRIQSTQVNFGADTDKLRHVLAESFLISAAYRCAGQLAAAPALRCSQSFFELENSTSRDDVVRKLRTGVALHLITPAASALPAGVTDFGRTLVLVSADYDDALLEQLFLDRSGTPLALDAYESAGRAAIGWLVQTGDQDEIRRRPALEDALWNQMKQTGQPGFAGLFPGIAAPFLGAIIADYSTIRWWADAMAGMAQQLARMRSWEARNPNAAASNPDFLALREQLASHLRDVAANTRSEFGQPWGVIAMNQLSGPSAPAKFFLTSPAVTFDKRRASTAVSPAS